MSQEVIAEQAHDFEYLLQLQDKERVVEDKLVLASLRGQELIQSAFLDLWRVASSGKLQRRQELPTSFNGKPADIEFVDFYARNTSDTVSTDNSDGFRVFITDPDSEIILSDVSFSRKKGESTWRAERAHYPENWKRNAGNPGISWKKETDVLDANQEDKTLELAGMTKETFMSIQAISQFAKDKLPTT